MSEMWIEELEAEAYRRVDAAEERERRERRISSERMADAAATQARRKVQQTYAETMSAKHFERAIEDVTDRLMRQRIIEARKASADYLRNYNDEEVGEFLKRRDSRGREPDFDFRITGPELHRDAVVNVVHVTLPELHYVFHVCPRTGQIL